MHADVARAVDVVDVLCFAFSVRVTMSFSRNQRVFIMKTYYKSRLYKFISEQR